MNKVYITDVLAKIGGLVVTVIGLMQICLAGNTQYSYDISRLKRFFYFERIDEDADSSSNDKVKS